MKRVLSILASILCVLSASAQTFEVYKNDTLVASYVNDETNHYKVIVKETPAKPAGPVKAEDGCYIIDGHHFVDLGLPSGLLWAETNVGADEYAEPGDYFAYGETSPKSTYYGSNYKYNGSTPDSTKYCDADGKMYLDPEDDAAYVNWGPSCRTPKDTEFDELANNCTMTWTPAVSSDNTTCSVGYRFTSKINNKSIYLPASGHWYMSALQNVRYGYYLTSTRCSGDIYAYIYYLLECGTGWGNLDEPRSAGSTLRPVATLPSVSE